MALKGLRQIAHEDVQRIMKDPLGFRWECTIENPSGSIKTFYVRSNDVHLVVDPGTDQLSIGRQATVVVLISDLMTAGFDSISSVVEDSKEPWIVEFANINGISAKFKVVDTLPDHTLGLRTLILELFDE